MRKFISTMVSLMVCLMALTALAAEVQVNILTVNDFHGNFRPGRFQPGAARLAGVVRELKQQNAKDVCLFIGAGDLYTGTTDANTFGGMETVKLFNDMGMDCDAAGNHAFDVPQETTRRQAQLAKYPFLSANLVNAKSGKVQPPFAPYTILERAGLKIGVVGLTTATTRRTATVKNLEGIKVLNPEQVAQKYIDELRSKGCDLVLLACHIGSQPDLSGEILPLINKTKNVDAYISGHTHELVAGKVNGIPLVQAEWAGQAVGLVKLKYDTVQKKVVESSAEYIKVADMPGLKDAEVEKKTNELLTKVDKLSSRIIGVNKADLTNDMHGQSTTAEVLMDLMREGMGADVTVLNGGAVRAAIPAGYVTVRNIKDVFPFNNNCVLLRVRGRNIRQALEHGFTTGPLRMVRFSGMKVRGDVTKPEGQRVLSVTMADGTPLDDNKFYKLATNDFLQTGGDDYTSFKKCKVLTEGTELCSFLAAMVEKKKTINHPAPDGRLEY